MPNGVEFEGRLVHIGTFPIGIDPEKFTSVKKVNWIGKVIHKGLTRPKDSDADRAVETKV